MQTNQQPKIFYSFSLRFVSFTSQREHHIVISNTVCNVTSEKDVMLYLRQNGVTSQAKCHVTPKTGCHDVTSKTGRHGDT